MIATLQAFVAAILGNPIGTAVIGSVISAMRVDYEAFQSWKTGHAALEYDWSIAAWRWFQAAGIGLVTGLGGWAVAHGLVPQGAALMLFGITLYAGNRRWRNVAVILLAATLVSSCATVDSFNRTSARLVSLSITATEQNRCTVHATPCLSDDQFKAANASLYKVSVAGQEFTKLRIAGKSSATDVSTFLSTVATETAVLSKAFPNGVIGDALSYLAELQRRAVKLLGSTK